MNEKNRMKHFTGRLALAAAALLAVQLATGCDTPSAYEDADQAAYKMNAQPALRCEENRQFAERSRLDTVIRDGVAVPAGFNTEEYKSVTENPFLAVATNPLSTFGADADTAGYTNLRRMLLSENRLPVRDAVRVEECLNYFTYDYSAPKNGELFSVNFELGETPWAKGRELLLVGVQGVKIDKEQLPPSNFVFLIDNSGSMYDEMPLLRESMTMLAETMRPCDRVSLVTYGGGAQVLLDSVPGSEKEKIKKVIASLESGGFTPGAEGIKTAYALAHKNFIKSGNNRVILVTDGDFNVGVSSESELVELIEKERSGAVYLTAIGMGYGNYKDNKLKMLANKGNGNYIFLDSPREARNALVNEMTGRMFTLAKDVKFQIEFNPARVYAYRLIGYELRKMADRDFNDDTKDSGEVGVGHQVTALYEIIPADAPEEVKKVAGTVDPLAFRKPAGETKEPGKMLVFKLRYQKPEGKDPSTLRTFFFDGEKNSTANWQWASAVVEFALLLRGSEYRGTANYDALRERAQKSMGADPKGERAEFLKMAAAARDLANAKK